MKLASAVYFLALLLIPAAGFSQSALQPPARLSAISDQLPTPAQTISTMELLATGRLKSGIQVAIWRYWPQDGEGSCDQSSGNPADQKTCPRAALLISTRTDNEDSSRFGLWKSDSRRVWRLIHDAATQDQNAFKKVSGTEGQILLVACEASEQVDSGNALATPKDTWHAVPYLLTINGYDSLTLSRQNEWADPVNCWKQDQRPVWNAGATAPSG